MDPPKHTRERALLMRLITPKRLKDNEAFMWRLADQQLDTFVADGRCEFISDFSSPFAMLAVADLLGVPEEDHERFRAGLGQSAGSSGRRAARRSSQHPAGVPRRVVRGLRRGPAPGAPQGRPHRLALATYPDGTTPEVIDVVRLATILFAAGQETTARLLASAAHLGRAPRAAGRAAGQRRAGSRTSSRRCCASRAR